MSVCASTGCIDSRRCVRTRDLFMLCAIACLLCDCVRLLRMCMCLIDAILFMYLRQFMLLRVALTVTVRNNNDGAITVVVSVSQTVRTVIIATVRV